MCRSVHRRKMLSFVEKWWSILTWNEFESFVCSRKST